jgi:hypothetical protein
MQQRDRLGSPAAGRLLLVQGGRLAVWHETLAKTRKNRAAVASVASGELRRCMWQTRQRFQIATADRPRV